MKQIFKSIYFLILSFVSRFDHSPGRCLCFVHRSFLDYVFNCDRVIYLPFLNDQQKKSQ